MAQKRRGSKWSIRAIAIALVAVMITGIIAVNPIAYVNRNAAITRSAEYAYLTDAMRGLTDNLGLSIWYRIRSWFANTGSAEGLLEKAGAALNADDAASAFIWAEKSLLMREGELQADDYLITACLAGLCGDVKKAREYAGLAVKRSPGDYQAQRFLRDYAYAAGDTLTALQAFGACAELLGDADELTQAARQFADIGDYAEAIRYNTLAMDAGAKTDESLFTRGSYHMQAGDYNAAIADFSRCTYPGSEYNLGMCEAALGRMARAEHHFEASIERNERVNDSKLMLSSCKLDGGEYEKAIALMNEYVQAGGPLADVVYFRANAYAMLNRYDEALANYNAAIAANVFIGDSLFGAGACLYYAARYSEAIERFNECVRLGVNTAQSKYYLGLSLAAIGDNAKAREMLIQAVSE